MLACFKIFTVVLLYFFRPKFRRWCQVSRCRLSIHTTNKTVPMAPVPNSGKYKTKQNHIHSIRLGGGFRTTTGGGRRGGPAQTIILLHFWYYRAFSWNPSIICIRIYESLSQQEIIALHLYSLSIILLIRMVF